MLCHPWSSVGLRGQAGEGVDRAIAEEELDGILDRRRVFGSCPPPWGEGSANEGRSSFVPLPREGAMYDFVDEVDVSVLSNVS